MSQSSPRESPLLVAAPMRKLHFDFDVDTCRKIEAHERVDRPFRWADDID